MIFLFTCSEERWGDQEENSTEHTDVTTRPWIQNWPRHQTRLPADKDEACSVSGLQRTHTSHPTSSSAIISRKWLEIKKRQQRFSTNLPSKRRITCDELVPPAPDFRQGVRSNATLCVSAVWCCLVRRHRSHLWRTWGRAPPPEVASLSHTHTHGSTHTDTHTFSKRHLAWPHSAWEIYIWVTAGFCEIRTSAVMFCKVESKLMQIFSSFSCEEQTLRMRWEQFYHIIRRPRHISGMSEMSDIPPSSAGIRSCCVVTDG